MTLGCELLLFYISEFFFSEKKYYELFQEVLLFSLFFMLQVVTFFEIKFFHKVKN